MQKSKLQLKIQKFLLRFLPVLFLITIWFVFAHPYFLRGLVPYASTYQANFFAPWSHYEEFNSPIKNNAMPDVHTQIYPWKKFTIETFKNGQIPLWNPYNFAGNPHLANFQSAVLSPLNLLFFFLPFIDAWSILILLQPLLAGFFMYLFVREIRVSREGCLISSIAFMFCGFIVVWMAYGTLAYAILYLPLALFAVERFIKMRKLLYLGLLTFTIPLSFFSGHFQISLYFLIGVVSYLIFRGLVTTNILNTFYLILSTIFGLVLSLPQLVSSIALYQHSVRSGLFAVGEAIPFQYLVTIIAPDFFGNPVTRNDWFGHYAEWAGFIGIWPLTLAIYAIIKFKVQSSKFKVIGFFAVLGVLSLMLAVSSPLSSFIVSLKIPVISTSALSRIIVLFSFSFAVLAGFGFDHLMRDVREGRGIRAIGVIGGVMGVILLAIWFLLFFSNIYPEEWLIVAKRNFILPTALFIGGAVLVGSRLFLRFTSGGASLLRNTPEVFGWTPRGWILLITCYLLLAISFDSLRFAAKWMPFDPRSLVYPDVPVIEAMRKNIGDGRVFGNLGAEVTTYYGIPSIEGYDPLYIGRYGEFLRSAGEGKYLEAERSVAKLARDGKYTDRVLDLLGVTLIFHPVPDTDQGWAYPVWNDKERFALVYKDDKFELYKNNQALPRASLFYNFEVRKDSKDVLKGFFSDDFDFRKILVLEEDASLVTEEGEGKAQIVSYNPNTILVTVQSTEPALLFLADNFYPGWKVMVNGQKEKIYRADYTFRAVKVPAGESIVEFTYAGWYL